MRKTVNESKIEGLIYQHSLQLRTANSDGAQYINGNLDIATDDDLTNIVTIHFTYVTPVFKASGKANTTFATLMNIINGILPNVMEHGADKAAKVRCDSAVGLNEFYSNRNGTEELVSAKRNEGGFVHTVSALNANENMRNTFKCDMIVTGFRRHEADEERGTTEYGTIKGLIFDFRQAILPVEFTITNPDGMNYFESLEVSEKNPVFTQVFGNQISTTVRRETVTTSAFGGDRVEVTESSRKEFRVTGAKSVPYEWDDPSSITAAELSEKMAERNVAVATIKQRQDEWRAQQAQKSGGAAPAPVTPTPVATAAPVFNF